MSAASAGVLHPRETAAARRDDVEALRKAFERNAVVLSDGELGLPSPDVLHAATRRQRMAREPSRADSVT